MRGGRLEVAPSLSPLAHLARPARRLPFPLAEPGATVFARARHGLWHGVRQLGLVPGDEVLAPAYHHGSEIEALERAGLGCRFYEACESLEPCEDELAALLSPRTRALHLVHPLGLPRDARRWRKWCDERGLLLIEDAAQAWLALAADGQPVGRAGDLTIFSLYKAVAVPDGGAVLAASPPQGRRRSGLRGAAGRHRSWLAQRWPRTAPRPTASPQDYSPARDFALGDPSAPPSRATTYLLRRIATSEVAERRRRNYRRLLAALPGRVPRPYDRLPPGASPMALAVDVEHRRRALEGLAARGVAALDLWSVPHPSLPVDRFPAAARRRAATIALPVHQGLRAIDVDRIAEAVTELA